MIEACTAYKSGIVDGHGIYLSNGSDWNIARYNETYNTVSSDFQINAGPNSTCLDDGVALDDPECDAAAGSSQRGGRGERVHALSYRATTNETSSFWALDQPIQAATMVSQSCSGAWSACRSTVAMRR